MKRNAKPTKLRILATPTTEAPAWAVALTATHEVDGTVTVVAFATLKDAMDHASHVAIALGANPAHKVGDHFVGVWALGPGRLATSGKFYDTRCHHGDAKCFMTIEAGGRTASTQPIPLGYGVVSCGLDREQLYADAREKFRKACRRADLNVVTKAMNGMMDAGTARRAIDRLHKVAAEVAAAGADAADQERCATMLHVEISRLHAALTRAIAVHDACEAAERAERIATLHDEEREAMRARPH